MTVNLNNKRTMEDKISYFWTGKILHFISVLEHICIDKLPFRQWCQLPAWQNMKNCAFALRVGEGADYYQFCRGANAGQLVDKYNICDGLYDCFDRQVGQIDTSSSFEIPFFWIE